jgi:OmpA-OmpF porin, OOP family
MPSPRALLAIASLLVAPLAFADSAIPGETRPAPIADGKIVLAAPIRFKTASAVILPESLPTLAGVAETLKRNPRIYVRIEVHTDDRGADDWNLKLSEDRAQSIKFFLVDRGIAVDRLQAHGYGETRPIAPNTTEANRAKNRRVELHVIHS